MFILLPVNNKDDVQQKLIVIIIKQTPHSLNH